MKLLSRFDSWFYPLFVVVWIGGLIALIFLNIVAQTK